MADPLYEAQWIAGDDGGLGRPMIDALHEAEWPIKRFNFGVAAKQEKAYINTGAVIWYEGRTLIEKLKVNLSNDRELIAQLTTRRGFPDSKCRLKLESKEDLRSRNLYPCPGHRGGVVAALAFAFGIYGITSLSVLSGVPAIASELTMNSQSPAFGKGSGRES
jgi:hypothetical protein